MHRRPGTTAFARPQSPAAKCLHLIRLRRARTRPELIEATGLSQPTITRAVTTLINAGLIRARADLAVSDGPGRPTTPLEPADFPAVFVGAAVGTSSTYLGLYDAEGRRLRDLDLKIKVSEHEDSDFLEHLVAGINRLTAGVATPLGALGVTTSGQVTERGIVDAPNLGWHGVDFAGRLRYHFDVPVTVSAAVPAILGSETQSANLPAAGDEPPRTLALFADDSISAAVTHATGVTQLSSLPAPAHGPGLPTTAEERLSTQGFLDTVAAAGLGTMTLEDAVGRAEHSRELRALLDERARMLGDMCAALIARHHPDTLVLAGSALTADPRAPQTFAKTVRGRVGNDVELRMIPGHREIVVAIARAVALDKLLRDPVEVADGVGAAA
ncbi:ROK family protein [Corynebacterium frankenforstense]